MIKVDLSIYHIHILTSVLKSFFRDMPEPLMTFDLYEEFIMRSGEFICIVYLSIYLLLNL